MSRRGALLLALAGAAGCGEKAAPTDTGAAALAEVDPFIGSGGVGFGVGSISPGPALPFGLARPGPDTGINGGRAPSFSHCAGYWWEDDELLAFSQIHLVGTGVPDYGALGLMPVGALPQGVLRPGDWRAGLEHGRESAVPGRYSVQLTPSGIGVDVSATLRTAVYRITYPAEGPRHLVVDLGHALGEGTTLDGRLSANAAAGEARGFVHHAGMMSDRYGGFTLHYVLRTDPPFEGMEAMQDGLRVPAATEVTGPAGVAVLRFPEGTAEVRVQVGLSFVDEAGAQANLEAEWVDFDLDAAVKAAQAAWADILGRVQVKGGRPEDRKMFYTALFHAYGMPTVLSDVDGRYRGVDGEVRTAEGWRYYSDFSLWDTFRTQHPLITLLTPDIQRDMNRSMWAMTEATGRVPKWPLGTGETNTMIAYHGESVWVDAVLKGVEGFDVAAAYDVLRASAFRTAAVADGRARDCAGAYLSLGYCPLDQEGGATSKTLEAAFSDFALAQLARHLGHTEDAEALQARSGSWRNLADPAAAILRGRAADGAFPEGFRDDVFSDDLVEGNARQWTVFVPQDVPGWAEALGGEGAAVAWLDDLFEQSAAAEDTPFPDLFYWHGNEPDLHAPFMFAELGRPDLTEKWAAWVRGAKYRPGPDGLDGNDDGGTLSAWYVFSALGFFPKVAEARYVLARPLFDEVQVNLPGGTLVVTSEGEGEGPVQTVTLDGAPLSGPFVEHRQLVGGGALRFSR
jgi:predicted alpha-1,2-mannosidase